MAITKHYQVVIIGAGMVGLSFAALMAQAGMNTAIIESDLPDIAISPDKVDARVSAINIAAEHLFEQLNLWSVLGLSATPIEQMKVWDGQSGARLEFNSADLGVSHLGSIIENRAIVKALWEALQKEEKLDWYCPAQAQAIQVNVHSANLQLADGSQLSADLIVGCDGAHSWLRQQMAADLHIKPYHQKAIVAVIHCAEAHQNIAWQNFLATGPLALLPLKDPHHCALVWSCDSAYADELIHYEPTAFNLALSNASELCLGKLELLNAPQAIPLIRRHVRHYVQPRLALLGDAAHTMHPLAGQGVNFGLMDASYLAKLIQDAHVQAKDIGSYKLLRRYERARKSENEIMLRSVGAFKTLFGLSSPSLVQLRAMGIQALNRASYLKERMAHYAMFG